MRSATAVTAFLFFFPILCLAQKVQTLPNNDEIDLVLTQTERAIQQYKPLIEQEATQLGDQGHEAAVKDRQVLDNLELACQAFRKNPQGFNGPLGFAFFEWLDDASRNALLSANYSSTQIAVRLIDGKTSDANSLLHLAQAYNDVSTLIYTVSENAGALYQRYIEVNASKQASRGAR
jgi:hypothetical protein